MLKDPIVKYQVLLKVNNAVINEHIRSGLFRLLAQEISKLFHYDRFSINLCMLSYNKKAASKTSRRIDLPCFAE